MNLELKAYKCAWPKLFEDCYNEYMWQDDKQFEVIYGKNQKEAVKERCTYDECFSFWELKEHIRTRRYPEMDLYNQDPSPLLKNLPKDHIHHLLHSLGVRKGDAYKGMFFRNYSMYYQKHERCEKLVELGLMDNYQRRGSEVYFVTEKGIEAVKTLLLIPKQGF